LKTNITIEKLITCAACLMTITVMSGCKEEDPNYYLYFSHETHVNEYDASCSDCHGESTDGRFTKPSHASCVDCHDDWIETAKISEKTCGQCHKERNLEELAELEAPEPTLAVGGAFVHTEALTDRCNECHGTLFGDKLFKVPELRRGEILRIRDEAHQWNMACDACHVDMDQEIPPPNHNQNWMRRHGALGQETDNTCGMCHQEESCSECHQEVMPDSHNNIWRLKTHGIEAAWDRARCQVCHEEDSCTACHEEVRPRSHNAAWERNHCMQCHQSSAAGTGCYFCHGIGLDDHPNPHPVNWRSGHCQRCHDGSPEGDQCGICHDTGLDSHPNPHRAGYEKTHCNGCHQDASYNGVSCSACHGGDLTENHPNPHSAGFENSHCNTCHAGSPQSEQCAICHEGGNSVLVHEDFWPPVHDRFGDQANCYDCHY